MAHWLDDIIALVKKEAHRLSGGNPDKAAQHHTAVAVLETVRGSGASHEEVRSRLVDSSAAKKAAPPPFAG